MTKKIQELQSELQAAYGSIRRAESNKYPTIIDLKLRATLGGKIDEMITLYHKHAGDHRTDFKVNVALIESFINLLKQPHVKIDNSYDNPCRRSVLYEHVVQQKLEVEVMTDFIRLADRLIKYEKSNESWDRAKLDLNRLYGKYESRYVTHLKKFGDSLGLISAVLCLAAIVLVCLFPPAALPLIAGPMIGVVIMAPLGSLGMVRGFDFFSRGERKETVYGKYANSELKNAGDGVYASLAPFKSR